MHGKGPKSERESVGSRVVRPARAVIGSDFVQYWLRSHGKADAIGAHDELVQKLVSYELSLGQFHYSKKETQQRVAHKAYELGMIKHQSDVLPAHLSKVYAEALREKRSYFEKRRREKISTNELKSRRSKSSR